MDMSPFRFRGRSDLGSHSFILTLIIVGLLATACPKKEETVAKAQDLCEKIYDKMRECADRETKTVDTTSDEESEADTKKMWDALECVCKEGVDKTPPTDEELAQAECLIKATCKEWEEDDAGESCAEEAGLCINELAKKSDTCEAPDEPKCLAEEKALRTCEDDRDRKDCDKEDDALDACEKKVETDKMARLGCEAKEDLEECESRVFGEIMKECGYDWESIELGDSDEESDGSTGTTTGTLPGSGTGDTSTDTSTDYSTYCGNEKIEKTRGEECDGSLLGDATCESLGFTAGSLRCTYSCKLDKSGCKGCGNGTVETDIGEECEPAPEDSTSTSSYSSSTKITKTCTELGYLGGTLGCDKSCKFDTSTCAGGKLLYSVQGYSDNSKFGEFVQPAGDINGDGKSDLLVLSSKASHPNGCSSTAIRLLSLRSGTDGSELSYKCMEPPAGVTYFSSPTSIDLGDVNGDGVRDFGLADSTDYPGTDYSLPASDAGQSCTTTFVCESGAKCQYNDVQCYSWSKSACTCADTIPYDNQNLIALYSGRDASVIGMYRKGEKDLPGTFKKYIGDVYGDGKSEAVFQRAATSTSPADSLIVTLATGATVLALATTADIFPFPDLNKDGKNDFVVSDGSANLHPTTCPGHITKRGVITIRSGSDGSELLVICGTLDGDALAYAGASVDVDADGTPDILAYRRGKLEALSGKDKSVLWEAEKSASNMVLLGDLDQDGVADFLMGGSSILSGKTGKEIAVVSLTGALFAADLAGDAALELVTANPSQNAGGLTYSGIIQVYRIDPMKKAAASARRFPLGGRDVLSKWFEKPAR